MTPLARDSVMEWKSLIGPGGPAAPAADQVIDVPDEAADGGSGES
ncbi:MAG: hypothetical protein WCS01_16985 [bacterium]